MRKEWRQIENWLSIVYWGPGHFDIYIDQDLSLKANWLHTSVSKVFVSDSQYLSKSIKKNGIPDACSTMDCCLLLTICPRCCPRHTPDMPQMMPQTRPRWCSRHVPGDALDMPQILSQTCPRWCPRHAPDNAPDMSQMLSQTCPRWCPRQGPDDAPVDAPDIPYHIWYPQSACFSKI